jgi:PAS domain S-box-containing protein
MGNGFSRAEKSRHGNTRHGRISGGIGGVADLGCGAVPGGALMEREYTALLEHLRDIILFVGEGGRIVEANRAAALAYGYSREEMRSLHIKDLRAPDTRPEVAAQMAQALREGLLFETVHRRRDGSLFPVEVSSKIVEPEGALLVSVIRDITERKRNEAELLRARDELEARVGERTQELEEVNGALRIEIALLEEAQGIIERQAAELLDRSAPVLALWEGLLFTPLVGPLDEARVAAFSGRLLAAITASGARIVLLDVTGVSKLDANGVRALFDVVAAARLVGAGVIVTGVRAAAARELATSGLDVSSLSTYSTLARGLAEALGRLAREGKRRAR